MGLEVENDPVDRGALWEGLTVYGVGGKLLEAVKAFYENSKLSVRINGM